MIAPSQPDPRDYDSRLADLRETHGSRVIPSGRRPGIFTFTGRA